MRESDGTELSNERHHLSPPPRLFERLGQITGYTWDQSIRPFHSVRIFDLG